MKPGTKPKPTHLKLITGNPGKRALNRKEAKAKAAIPAPPPGKRYTIGAGVGTYGGKDAMAIGFRGAVTDRVSVTLGVSHNSVSKTAANAGVGYSW